MRAMFLVTLLGILLTQLADSYAQALPPLYASVSTDRKSFDEPDYQSCSNLYPGLLACGTVFQSDQLNLQAHASGSLEYAPEFNISANSTFTTSPNINPGLGAYAQSRGLLIYSMRVVGQPGTPVPITMEYFYSIRGNAGSLDTPQKINQFIGAGATWTIKDESSQIVFTDSAGLCESDPTSLLHCDLSQGATRQSGFDLLPNQNYTVVVQGYAVVWTCSSGAGNGCQENLAASISFDPVFSVGGGLASSYSLAFSEGINNSLSPVPEPTQRSLFFAAAMFLSVLRLSGKLTSQGRGRIAFRP